MPANLCEYAKTIHHTLSIACTNSLVVPTPCHPKAIWGFSYRYTRYHYASLANYPYTFKLSDNAQVVPHFFDGENYWIDIVYPSLNTTIHCSYKPVRDNFRSLAQDAQEFLYKHSTVASAIPVQEFANPENDVWGLYFELKGNTATPIQFVLTDSIEHFFRGSVYCNDIPNQDSLVPIYDYMRQDVRVLMESMKWQ